MKITDIKVFLSGPYKNGEPPVQNYRINPKWLSTTEIANPMSIHPEFRATRDLWLGNGGRTIVQVIAEDGTYGLGESAGGRASAEIIAGHFKKLLIGRQAHEIERNWDIMWRSSMPYGRKGAPVMAISAVDYALWDLLAKTRKEPLYVSLGGAAQD